MKKNLLILMAVCTLFVTTISESNAQFSMGIRLGANASKYTGDFSADFVPGLHIGPYFRVGFKDKYRVSADLLFSTKGGSNEYTTYNNLGVATGTSRAYQIPFYIDIPVLFNYKPIAGLYIEAGGQPSIALTAINYDPNEETEFDKGNLKTMDFAPVVGLGYEFKKVSLGLRGIFGVTNVNSFSAFGFNPTQKNLTLQATFGFKII